jgi:hypothetical protein
MNMSSIKAMMGDPEFDPFYGTYNQPGRGDFGDQGSWASMRRQAPGLADFNPSIEDRQLPMARPTQSTLNLGPRISPARRARAQSMRRAGANTRISRLIERAAEMGQLNPDPMIVDSARARMAQAPAPLALGPGTPGGALATQAPTTPVQAPMGNPRVTAGYINTQRALPSGSAASSQLAQIADDVVRQASGGTDVVAPRGPFTMGSPAALGAGPRPAGPGMSPFAAVADDLLLMGAGGAGGGGTGGGSGGGGAAAAGGGGAAAAGGGAARSAGGVMSRIEGSMLGKALKNPGIRTVGGTAFAGASVLGGVNQIADMGIAALNGGENPEGRWDEALSMALAAGAAGATVAGPWGLLAAIPGGIYGYLSGDDSNAAAQGKLTNVAAEQDVLARQYMAALGLDDNAQTKVLAQMGFFAANAETEEELKQLYQQMIPQMAASADSAMQQQARFAAISDQLLPKISQFNERAYADSVAYSESAAAAAQNFNDPTLQAIFAANAKAIPMYQSQANAAYMAQLSALMGQATTVDQSLQGFTPYPTTAAAVDPVTAALTGS